MWSYALDLAANHRKLIEDIIRSNPRYWGNEDLLEAFCSDVYKKSYLLLDSVSNIDNLKTYLEKVVDTSIASILKQNGRDDSPKQKPAKSDVRIDILDNTNIKKQIIEETNISETELERATELYKRRENRIRPLRDDKIISLKDDSNDDIKVLKGDIYGDIEDPKLLFPDTEIKEAVINRILSIVYSLHVKHPEKAYFQIFYSRHIRLKKQDSIASELKITQGELSKRYFELIKLVKECL